MTRQSLLRSPGVHKASVFALVLAGMALGLGQAPDGLAGSEFFDSFEAAAPGPWQTPSVDPRNSLAFMAPSAEPRANFRASGAWDGTKALEINYDPVNASPLAEVKADFPATAPVAVRMMIYVPSATAAAMGSGDEFRFARLMSSTTNATAALELWVKKENGAIHIEGGLPAPNRLGDVNKTDIAPDTWHTVMLTYEEKVVVVIGLTCDVKLYVDDLKSTRDEATGLALLIPNTGALAVGLTGAARATTGGPWIYWLDDVKISPNLNVGLSSPLVHLQQDGYEAANIATLPPPSGKALVTATAGSVAQINNGHRGGGMSATDTSTAASGSSAAYGQLVGLDAGLKLYHRVWWRQGGGADAGMMHPVTAIASDALQGTPPLYNPMAALSVGSQGVLLSGYSLLGGNPSADPAAPQFFPLDAGWHLLELLVAPTFGDGGVRTAWVDGQQVGSSNANWPAAVRPQRWIDGHFPDPGSFGYLGTDEYDDSRTSVVMQPSQFGLTVTAPLDAGACAALPIRAFDSAGGFAPAPEDAWLSYDTYGAGAFYNDPSCMQLLPAAASLLVPSGQTGAMAFFRPTGATGSKITLSHPDYLSRDTSININVPPPPDTLPPSAPGQPGFSTLVTNRPVLATWSPARDDGGSGLLKYVVEASADGGSYFLWTTLPAVEDVPGGFVFDGGEAYWKLRVRADDDAGNAGPYSPESFQLTMDFTPPNPPPAPPLGSIDGGFANIQWGPGNDPPPAPSGIQSYAMTWTSTPPGGGGGSCAGTTLGCSFPVTPGHQYTLQVHAVDNAGNVGVDGPAGTLTFPGPLAGLRLLGFPAGPSGAYAVVGDPNPVTVEAVDSNGAVVPGYLGSVRFTAKEPDGTDYSASLPGVNGVYGFIAADQGRHFFPSGYTFNSTGVATAAVTDLVDTTITGEVMVTVIARGEVVIIHDANGYAARGLPYRYNGVGAVRAVSSEPLTFSTCESTPGDFVVDGTSGAVAWTPSSSASFPASICIRAQAASGGGDDTYRFQIAELPPSNLLPVARFVASPNRADIRINVAFDSTSSTWDPDLGAPSYRWRFGDGSRLGFRADPFRAYLLPGGYRPSLVLADGVGRTDQTSRSVQVLDRSGRLPPLVSILSPPQTGVNALDVALQAQSEDGLVPTGPIRWDLGNGAYAEGGDAGASYLPGRYWATASTVDSNGLPATDKVEIAVARDGRVPPLCAATVDPTVVNAAGADGGRATVDWIAWRAPGTKKIASVSWKIDGVAYATGVVSLQYSTAGWRRGYLTVTDEDGLKCRDSVAVLVLNTAATAPAIPPRILDPGVSGPINCRDPYAGRPAPRRRSPSRATRAP
jgi:hypothetical protein